MLLSFIIVFLIFMAGVSIMMAFGFEKSNGENFSIVIVPGAKVHGDSPSNILKNRLDKALELLNKNEDAVCIVSGGRGVDEEYTEASVMKNYLINAGISDRRVYTEDKSVNTKQNFLYTAQIIKANSLSGSAVITTDYYHSYRCCLYAGRAGIKAAAYPCKTRANLLPFQWIREIFGVVQAIVLR